MIKNLLIIEDDENSARILKRLLNRNGFAQAIQVVQNGKEAIDYLEAIAADPQGVAPELILLDIFMPHTNGWEFLEWFSPRYRQDFANTSVCMITASDEPGYQLKAAGYPCVVVLLQKPLTPKHLFFLNQFQTQRQRLYRS